MYIGIPTDGLAILYREIWEGFQKGRYCPDGQRIYSVCCVFHLPADIHIYTKLLTTCYDNINEYRKREHVD